MKHFFGQQDQARLNTRKLLPYFLLAILATVAALYGFLVVLCAIGRPILEYHQSLWTAIDGGDRAVTFLDRFWMPTLFLGVSAATLLIILSGSLYKIVQLRQGGSVVALALGGRRIEPHTDQLDERRLLNVVAEMSIASGLPVPEVYVLDRETSLNAFAAGHTINDAVVGVTEGALRWLSRDELQGVLAHEFSHIRNGDMRLNLRLMGLVHGLFGLAWLAERLMTLGQHRPLKDKSLGEIILDLARGLVGLVVAFIGFNSALFGRMIKSAVSRQREFLADAAAVQFTRFPDGLAAALKKAEAWGGGAVFAAPNAEAASHIFFNNVLADDQSDWTSTHPPLTERIRRLDPQFNQSIAPPDFCPPAPEPSAEKSGPPAPPFKGLRLEELLAHAGTPTRKHLAHASQVRASLPKPIKRASREPFGACALVYALLLSADENARAEQLAQLEAKISPAIRQEMAQLLPLLDGLQIESKVPLIELAIPALRRLSAPQYEAFAQTVQFIIHSDQVVDVFEFTLEKMLLRHLEPCFKPAPAPVLKHKALRPLARECAVLLSTLAHAGQEAPEAVEAAFRLGGRALGLPADDLERFKFEDCTLVRLEAALDELAQATPGIRNQVLNACAQAVSADGLVRVEEAELLRAVADSLDCPLPPLI